MGFRATGFRFWFRVEGVRCSSDFFVGDCSIFLAVSCERPLWHRTCDASIYSIWVLRAVEARFFPKRGPRCRLESRKQQHRQHRPRERFVSQLGSTGYERLRVWPKRMEPVALCSQTRRVPAGVFHTCQMHFCPVEQRLP